MTEPLVNWGKVTLSEMTTWASLLATAVETIVSQGGTYSSLKSVKAVSSEVVEVVYAWPGETLLRGIRIDLDAMQSASDRIKSGTIEELAFNLIHLGMDEGRPIDEFSPPDQDGVRWLPPEQWLSD